MPRPRPGAGALFPLAPLPPTPHSDRLPLPALELTPATQPPQRKRGRQRRFAAERELLATLALAGALAAGATFPRLAGTALAGTDLLLAAAALGSLVVLLGFGLRFRLAP